MKELDFGMFWMIGVMSVMIIYGLFALFGINKSK